MEHIKLTEEEFMELRGMETQIEDAGGIDLADVKDTAELVQILESWRRYGQLEMKEMLANEQGYEMS
jgi:hypothetical protein